MKTHNYQNFQFPQTTEDQIIAGHLIPKGYFNASLMAKNWGKKINEFNRLDSTKKYIDALELDINQILIQESSKTIQELRKTVKGWINVKISITTRKNVSNKLAGVWFHPELAIKLAGWLDVNFEIWMTRGLRLALENKVDSVDFHNFKQELQAKYDNNIKPIDSVDNNQSRLLIELNELVSTLEEKVNNQNQKIAEIGKKIKARQELIDAVDDSYLNLDEPECKYDAFSIYLQSGISDYNYFKSVLRDRYKFKKDYKIVNWKKDDIRRKGDGRYRYLVTAKTMHNLLLTFRSKEGVDIRALPEIYRKLVKEALDNNINSRELRSR